ncbi:MAG TPA: C25 family peptidase propeptide domain-containing protein, partial [Candidatus Cloacimonadota bacterium]|nr:C25 family peptidase propeptide domain-containing protein [Candidatus Cloacimonadota bacterium]
MKKHLLLLMFMAMILSVSAGTITLQQQASEVRILSSSSEGLSVRFALDRIQHNEINTKEGVWTMLGAENYTTTNTVGNPALPLMRKIISVPLGASVEYQLVNTIRRQISLEEQGVYYPILPYQEPVAKCEDPNQLKFNVNRDFYNGSRSTTENMIQISELGMMRGERLFALDFVPVNYNPATKSLDIVVSTQVDIRFVNADHVSSATLKARTRSVVFESALSSSICNYPATRTTLLTYPIGYVIITPQ